MSYLIGEEFIRTRVKATSKEEVLQILSDLAAKLGITKERDRYLTDLRLREEQYPTGIGQGLAVPHCKSKAVLQPSVIILKLEAPVMWDEELAMAADVIFNLAVPASDGDNIHIRLLSGLARRLNDEVFVRELRGADTPAEVSSLFAGKP